MWPASWAVWLLIGMGVALLLPAGWIGLFPAILIGVVIVALPLGMAGPLGRRAGLLALGLAWSLATLHPQVERQLPGDWQQRDVPVVGVIDGLPEKTAHGWRFNLRVTQAPEGALEPGARLRVSWRGERALHPGDAWALWLRLRKPHGSLNPGGFDYEKWLFRHRIAATGYVRDHPDNRLVASGSAWAVHRWRDSLRGRIIEAAEGRAETSLLLGLSIGDRSMMDARQWEVLIATGTNHLLAISGLHVGIVAGMTAWLVLMLWRRVAPLALRVPAQQAAAAAAVLAALAYALLAGFSIPTQRAVIMLAVALCGVLLARAWRPLDLLALAALMVVGRDPLALLDVGFWLSFSAVAVILFLLVGGSRRPGPITGLLLIQFGLFVGLLPLTAGFFGHVAWTSALANLIAVPVVSFLVAPLTLAGTLLLLIWPWAGSGLLVLAASIMSLLMAFLVLLADLPIERHLPASGWLALTLAGLGAIWLMAPRRWPARWLGLLPLLPLLWPPDARPPEGHYRLYAFDVGQGLAMLVRTRDHALLYDAGPAWQSGADAGERMVLPALRALGIRRLDGLIISHRHLDHAGGAESVIAAYPSAWVIAGEPDAHDLEAVACVDGQQWRWNGVHLETRHAERVRLSNDHSCVLRIEGKPMTALLTGDVEWLGERLLMADGRLEADLLQVPHHGSRTSSAPAFIDAVSPRVAWVSTGHLNRLGHPVPEVLARYHQRGIPVYDTAWCGAIALDENGQQRCWRRDGYPWIWRHRIEALPLPSPDVR